MIYKRAWLAKAESEVLLNSVIYTVYRVYRLPEIGDNLIFSFWLCIISLTCSLQIVTQKDQMYFL